MTTREELHRLVWSEPMTKIAERFEVSGSYLARICTLLNVPRPERGYWAKLAVGKAPPQRPLPEARPGDPLDWSRDGGVVRAPRPAAPARREPKAVPVKIPRNQVHALIRGAKAQFENGRAIEEGAYLKPYKKLLVDVTASQACLDKALGLANDLFNALESVGHRVVIASADSGLRRETIEERESPGSHRDYWYRSGLWTPYRPTIVYIGSVAIGLAIVEMSEKVTLRYVRGKYIREADYVAPKRASDHSWTTTQDLPSGRLRIIAYAPYGRVTWSAQWQDTAKALLGPSLGSIVAALEEAAYELVAKLEAAERQAEIEYQARLAEEERRRREEDRRRVEQSFTDSEEELHEVIREWPEVVSIERFLSEVERRAAGLPDGEKDRVLQRLALAREFLGTQDPLDFFLGWKTPEERYQQRYADDQDKEDDEVV